jgi:lipase ATG15
MLNLNFKTIYELAVMSYNVYHPIDSIRKGMCTRNWIDLHNTTVKDLSIQNNSLRMYMFSKDDQHVIAIKGTTMYWGDFNNNESLNKTDNENTKGESENKENVKGENESVKNSENNAFSSAYNDKYNDNLFFSCCYYKNSLFETCDKCNKGTRTDDCCVDCYKDTLDFELNYLNISIGIIENLKGEMDIQNANVIFTGHSLGGAIASYLGLYYDKPAVGFQSPGDLNYASRVLDKTFTDDIYHFGHDADPLFLGDCGKLCSSFGYQIDTKCHVGNTCMYKAKEKLNYTESILNHRIDYIIKHVIPHWQDPDHFPECKMEQCEDKC